MYMYVYYIVYTYIYNIYIYNILYNIYSMYSVYVYSNTNTYTKHTKYTAYSIISIIYMHTKYAKYIVWKKMCIYIQGWSVEIKNRIYKKYIYYDQFVISYILCKIWKNFIEENRQINQFVIDKVRWFTLYTRISCVSRYI